MQGPSLFVAYTYHLDGVGGVQTCTAEFIASLRAAGLELEIVPVEPDRRWTTRVLRRFNASAYCRPLSARSLAAIRDRAKGVRYIFLNQMSLAGALSDEMFAGQSVVGLSHGCEITDLVHLYRLHRVLPLSGWTLRPFPSMALARALADEMAARRMLAGVIGISPFDADCERWLGTGKVSWIPRTIVAAPIDRNPVPGRFGYIGTLDHSPNLEGLVSILAEMDRVGSKALRIRVIGGPERLGRWLTSNYESVDYLGPLDDDAARHEAASWNGFVHPIFCLPRGCSTKLAGALSWGLPIVTTPEGRRGYEWHDGALIEVDSPASFVTQMIALTDPAADRDAADKVARVVRSSPTLAEVATRVSVFLTMLQKDASGIGAR